MRGGFGDRCDGNGHDGNDRRERGLRQRESGQREDAAVAGFPNGGGNERIHGHLVKQVHAVCAPARKIDDGGDHTAERRAQKQRQLSEEAFEVSRKEDRGKQSGERHEPHKPHVAREGRGRRVGIRQRVARKRQTDDHRDGTRDGGGQDLFYGVGAEQLDDKTCGNGDKAGHHNAELRVLDRFRRQCRDRALLPGKHLRICLGRELFHHGLAGDQRRDRRQIREARPVVERDLAPGDQDKADRGKAAGEDRGGHLKTGDQRHGDRRREHDDDLLHGVQQQLPKRRPFVGEVAVNFFLFHPKPSLFYSWTAQRRTQSWLKENAGFAQTCKHGVCKTAFKTPIYQNPRWLCRGGSPKPPLVLYKF